MNTDPALDTCGCCEGVKPLTPAAIDNPPGFTALAWRVGTHARFKQSLLAALSADPALRPLTARTDDDPSIALLDAWATALDVLTFYQERIANENYLRTATEQRSILHLARAIGYELRPGVSASALLAFTLDSQTIAGAIAAATIPAGAKIQSIPGQDEKPQLFETSSELPARATWNSLAARTRGSKIPALSDLTLHLEGVSTGLQPGDALLIIGDERANWNGSENWDFRRVQSLALTVAANPNDGYTTVTLDRPLGKPERAINPAQKNPRVFGLRRRAALFGYNAPDPRLLNPATLANFPTTGTGATVEWANFNISYNATIDDTVIHLDGPQPAAVQGSWIVLAAGSYEEVYRITKTDEAALTQFGLAGKATKLTLDGENLATVFGHKLRETSVFLQTDELKLAAVPIIAPIPAGSAQIDLAAALSGDDTLPSGRQLIVTDGANTEPVTLKSASIAAGVTVLEFNENLAHAYARERVKILANVAAATHGETRLLPSPDAMPIPGATNTLTSSTPPRTEVLGSGDGAQVFQKFTLKQKPLTYVSAATPSGGATTLSIRVNDVLWHEVPSFYSRGPKERIYVTRRADDGTVTVQFGDGRTGARLPTGSENVTALYRVGAGAGGNVRAGQLSLLLTRPLGVNSVANPKPATGGADGEQLAQARENAPLTVLTLDRVVSLRDCEDFARAYAGIGKAAATLIWDGEFQKVHLTIAASDGGAVDPTSTTFKNLVNAIDAARHPLRSIVVQTYSERQIKLAAKVAVDPEFDAKEVFANLIAALAERFSFATRNFGQAVTSSEVFAAAQAVPGVIAIDLDKLYFAGEPAILRARLPAHSAWLDATGMHPAELLTLAADAISLTPMSS